MPILRIIYKINQNLRLMNILTLIYNFIEIVEFTLDCIGIFG